jgi:RNA polymerase sigma-B factor
MALSVSGVALTGVGLTGVGLTPRLKPLALARRRRGQALLRSFSENGDPATRARLVTEYMPLVSLQARRYAGRGEQHDDLVQVGSIGLLKAIDRFDVERGVEFTTYAVPKIVGEIKRHFRDKVWPIRVPRPLQELYLRLSSLRPELTASLGRTPTIAELAVRAGASVEEVAEALEVNFAFRLRSLSAGKENEDGDEVMLAELIGDEAPAFETAENRLLLEPGLRRLDGRERMILHMRFYRGLTQSQIAAEVGVSQMHVSRLIRKSLDDLRENIEAA